MAICTRWTATKLKAWPGFMASSRGRALLKQKVRDLELLRKIEDLLSCLLVFDGVERPGIEFVLKHPLLSGSHLVQFQMLPHKLSDVCLGQRLGAGHFALTHTAMHKYHRDKKYAIKILSDLAIDSYGNNLDLEISIGLQLQHHRNLVPTVHIFRDKLNHLNCIESDPPLVQHASDNCALHQVCLRGESLTIITECMNRDHSTVRRLDTESRLPLDCAISIWRDDQLDVVSLLFSQEPAMISEADTHGILPLHRACSNGCS